MEVTGRIRVPGDKSITQRLLMFGALANGESVIQRPLRSHDTRSMIDALSSLGVAIEAGPNSITIVGRGRRALVAPVHMVECGNSGTAARFLIGAIAAHPMDATIAGDESLNRRPMRRVTRPLAAMGGRFTEHNGDGLPLTVRGGELDPLEDYALPQASAQVKTALLLAGYAAGVPVSLVEPFRSRDHTERILRELGLDVAVEGNTTAFTPSHPIEGFETRVPGDPSSAAFVVGHLLLTDSRTTTIESLGINPTRMGFFRVLQRMGADIHWSETGAVLGEPVGELTVTGSRQLSAARVAPGEVPSMIDEIPMLAVLAARAAGTTVFEGVGELVHKESNRLELLRDNLRSIGVDAETGEETLTIVGTDVNLTGRVDTANDHRMAMAFAVLARAKQTDIELSETDSVAVSYPTFFQDIERETR